MGVDVREGACRWYPTPFDPAVPHPLPGPICDSVRHDATVFDRELVLSECSGTARAFLFAWHKGNEPTWMC